MRGSGRLLALIGAPMGCSGFAALAEEMSSDHTVVTYDPRGTDQTTVTDRTRATPDVLAEDVHQVLSAVTAADDLTEPVAVLGSSGGAVTGLALVTAHPEQVAVLIAHEPPVITLLDDAADQLGQVEEIYQTYLRSGADAAMRQFMLAIGVLGDEGARHFTASPHPPTAPAPQVPRTDNDFFYANQLRATTSYEPDLTGLAKVSTRIVVGVGATSAGQLAHRTGPGWRWPTGWACWPRSSRAGTVASPRPCPDSPTSCGTCCAAWPESRVAVRSQVISSCW